MEKRLSVQKVYYGSRCCCYCLDLFLGQGQLRSSLSDPFGFVQKVLIFHRACKMGTTLKHTVTFQILKAGIYEVMLRKILKIVIDWHQTKHNKTLLDIAE